jgi:hypothetical protein
MSEQLSTDQPLLLPPVKKAPAKKKAPSKTQSPAKAPKKKAKSAPEKNVRALPLRKAPPTEFEIFYAQYPRRVGKPYALMCWNAAIARGVTVETIMKGLAEYRFSRDPKFIPHPSTFLNQSRWDDVEPDLSLDPFGLNAWLETLPPSKDGPSPHWYHVEDLQGILIAMGFDPTWRGPLDVLDGWLKDGYQPDSVSRVIAQAVAEFGRRASLQAFDKRVRYRADRTIGGN